VQPDDGAPRHVPDSTAAFTLTQARIYSSPRLASFGPPPLPISSLMAASRRNGVRLFTGDGRGPKIPALPPFRTVHRSADG